MKNHGPNFVSEHPIIIPMFATKHLSVDDLTSCNFSGLCNKPLLPKVLQSDEEGSLFRT
jgi:hypothetical protein